jgi:energy-coupling factor transporter ATP-binding protein EcfA2
MADSIQFITKIEIKNLWDRYDLVWHLDRDVNILSGINGSGKSTILNCVARLIMEIPHSNQLNGLIKHLVVYFSGNQSISIENFNSIEEKSRTLAEYKTLFNALKVSPNFDYEKAKSEKLDILSFSKGFNLNETHSYLPACLINTFDKPLKTGNFPNENVKTELDKDIYLLQKEYLDYQLNIGKKAFEIVSNNNGSSSMQDVLNIKKQQERFLEIMDSLFKDTDKKIDRTKNEIAFISGGKTLSPYQLSSGEKQILVILLTVLIQNNKPSILFMDEPEISLHIDWQKKLIQYIKELNPNVQIILATHSPAVVMEGWLDKVFEISDLITLDRKAK